MPVFMLFIVINTIAVGFISSFVTHGLGAPSLLGMLGSTTLTLMTGWVQFALVKRVLAQREATGEQYPVIRDGRALTDPINASLCYASAAFVAMFFGAASGNILVGMVALAALMGVALWFGYKTWEVPAEEHATD
jgi:hypothetical protein